MKKAILRTLAYADVFDYPLKKEEIFRFLISSIKVSKHQGVSQALKGLPQISQEEGFLFLKGREKIVAVRKKREKESQKKLAIAQRTGRWLRFIPPIKMVAVTGALAMKNSQKEDDVDLLIVTSKNRLWLTRLLTVLSTELVARRRRPGDKEFANKICLNMFLDENHLAVPEKERDLFSAHEVCQMRLIWDRDDTYMKFLQANLWIRDFLPNSLDIKILRYEDIKGKQEKNFLISQFLNFLENLAYKLQLLYMSSRKTTEITESGRLRFHPKDAREWVLPEYKKRLRKLGIE